MELKINIKKNTINAIALKKRKRKSINNVIIINTYLIFLSIAYFRKKKYNKNYILY